MRNWFLKRFTVTVVKERIFHVVEKCQRSCHRDTLFLLVRVTNVRESDHLAGNVRLVETTFTVHSLVRIRFAALDSAIVLYVLVCLKTARIAT